MSAKRSNVILVVGAPGSGKSTQCKRIAKDFGYVHISVGDLLRSEAEKPDSEVGKKLKETMKNGSLASAELICKLLDEKVLSDNDNDNDNDNKQHSFLIDGFPRNMENVEEWNKSMKDRVNLQCVLVYDCDEKTSMARCLERGKSSGRSDDNEDSMKKRIATFNESTRPAIAHYQKENLVARIDASHDVEKVYDDTRKTMNEHKCT